MLDTNTITEAHGREGFLHRSRVRIKPCTNRRDRRKVGFPSPPRVSFPKGDVRFAKCGLNPRLIFDNPFGLLRGALAVSPGVGLFHFGTPSVSARERP